LDFLANILDYKDKHLELKAIKCDYGTYIAGTSCILGHGQNNTNKNGTVTMTVPFVL